MRMGRDGMSRFGGGIGLGLVVLALALSSVASAASCPPTVDPAAFATPAGLRDLNAVEGDLGPRPTASPAHEAFIDWLDQESRAISGVDVSSLPYEIQRWGP